MKIVQAKSAGFCYGVKRAVELAERTAAEGHPCVMLGPIIHNAHVVQDLKDKGMGCVSSMDEIPEGSAVLIRSHGESRAVYAELERRGIEIIDATCPNVAHIHKIVSEAEQNGRTIVIFGKKSHPEVLATAGWCSGAFVVETPEELEKWLLKDEKRCKNPLTMVSQTTASRESWKKSVEIAKNLCTNAKIFDTICNATYHRQAEAVELAGQCDVMVIIGDHQSSNTRHLAELCNAQCNSVIWIEQAGELSHYSINHAACVGITAGASTPGWIIKEVNNKMSEEIMEIEESFEEMLEKSFKTLNNGDKVTCTVVNVTPTEIQVELGTKHTGYISENEFTDDASVKLADAVKVGDQLECVVMRVNDQDGIVTLSKKKLDANKNWEAIEEAFENKTIVEGLIKEVNKGGIVANVKGIRVFVPGSQTGLRRDEPMDGLVGTTARMKITEVVRGRRRVVGSIRDVVQAERDAKAQAIWNDIEIGKQYTGTVKSLTEYGAFVDIGGVDGMVHVTELSWSRVRKPKEVVAVGDTVEVFVKEYNPEKKRISLTMKNPEFSPWQNFMNSYAVGDVLSVKIVKLMGYGAFAEIVPGVDGLIHISQIADHRIEKPEDELKEGQTVEVKITAVDEDKQKVSLSRRAVLTAAPDEE